MRPLTRKLRRHCVANAPERGKYAQEGKRPTVDHFLSINVNGQLAIMALDHHGLDAEVLPQVGRRTGGLNP